MEHTNKQQGFHPLEKLSSVDTWRKDASSQSHVGFWMEFFVLIIIVFLPISIINAQTNRDMKNYAINARVNACVNSLALRAMNGDQVATNKLFKLLGTRLQKVADKFYGYSRCIEFNDLIQEGKLACWKALKFYRPACGNFLSYALTVAKNAMIDALVDYCGDGMPKSLLRMCSKVSKAESKYELEFGYTPSDIELADYGSFTLESVENARHFMMKFISLDAFDNDDDDFNRADYIDYSINCADDKDLEASEEKQKTIDLILKHKGELPEENRKIVELYNMYDWTYEEITNITGKSIEDARKKNKGGIKMIKEAVEKDPEYVA